MINASEGIQQGTAVPLTLWMNVATGMTLQQLLVTGRTHLFIAISKHNASTERALTGMLC